MVGVYALDKCDGLREDGDITLKDAFHHLTNGERSPAETAALQIGVDDRRLRYSTIDLQACIF
jgi:hypothetical protein